MEINQKTGIYKITNLINNKIYIGQSVDIYRRFTDHINFSQNQKAREYNTPIHRAIRKYGKENFAIEILELCDKSELNEKEIFYIKKFNSTDRKIGYNLTQGGFGTLNYNCKKVLQYDLEGNFIKKWNSIREASSALNISMGNIRTCCCGQKSAGGFQWKYENDKKIIKKYVRNYFKEGLEKGRKKVRIKMISKDKSIVKIFDSLASASIWLQEEKYTNAKNLRGVQSRISTVKNKNKLAYGFYWQEDGDGQYS